MTMRNLCATLAIVMTVTTSASIASAAPPAEKEALAEALFQEGKRLVEAGRYQEADAKFKESYDLDPGSGTKAARAGCHEESGRLATAWAMFVEVADELKRASDQREAQARARAEALAPRVPKLTILVSSETAAIPGLEIRRNGAVLRKALWNQPLPVDPGEQAIEARAPGKKAVQAKVSLRERESVSINVPSMEDMKAGPSGPMPPQRIGALVAGGLGVAGLVVGGVFGARTFSQWGDAEEECPQRQGCNDKAIELEGAARKSATISNVGFIAGGVGMVTAGILWLTTPSAGPRAERAGLQVVPVVGPKGALGMIRATF